MRTGHSDGCNPLGAFAGAGEGYMGDELPCYIVSSAGGSHGGGPDVREEVACSDYGWPGGTCLNNRGCIPQPEWCDGSELPWPEAGILPPGAIAGGCNVETFRSTERANRERAAAGHTVGTVPGDMYIRDCPPEVIDREYARMERLVPIPPEAYGHGGADAIQSWLVDAAGWAGARRRRWTPRSWEHFVRASGRPVDATGLTAVLPRLPHTPCEWFGPDVTGNVYGCSPGFGSTLAGQPKRKRRSKRRRGFVGWCPCKGRPPGL